MSKTSKKALKILVVAGVVALLAYVLPVWLVLVPVLAYLAMGAIDVARNDRPDDVPVLKRYFAGNGLLTWLLAPFNLLMDLLSARNKGVLGLSDLPADCRREVEELVSVLTRERESIIARLRTKLANSERVMLLYRWYGRQVDTSIPEFNKDFRYLKTVGISVFLPNTATKYHYGPLRITYRLLYNLTPVADDRVFIEVGHKKHIWHDDPLFIFDDTLMHRSVNGSDQARYCVFADIMRPSPVLGLTTKILGGVGGLLNAFKHLFYKNWDFVN